MKFIIAENQQIRLRNTISKLLDTEFGNSEAVCEIKVYTVDEEEEDYQNGLRFDIYVYFNENYYRNLETGTGIYRLILDTKKNISNMFHDWFGLNQNQYVISTSSKNC
jgi:hypothetical protein